MPGEAPSIPEELVPFIESGVSIVCGMRDAALRSHAVRGVGVIVHADRRTLTVFLPDAPGAAALAAVRDVGRIAVTFTRPSDHRSLQLKGNVRAMRAADPAERAGLERYVEAWGKLLELVGLPTALGAGITYWPATAVEAEIDAIFIQTPGPSAGTPFVASSP